MENRLYFCISTLALESAGNKMRPGCYCVQFAALDSAKASECWRCLVVFSLFFPCLSEKARSERARRGCRWPFHTCLTAADPISRGNLLRCTFGWRACTCQTDAWLTETLTCTLSSDEHAWTRGWLCSDGCVFRRQDNRPNHNSCISRSILLHYRIYC